MEEEKPKLEEDLTSKPDENVHKKEVKNDDEIRIRQDKVVNFFKKKANWIYYILLAFLVYIAVYIRTLNLSKLKDVTTGTWTLGPDLDPFLFLRWAKEIISTGGLAAIDAMRYSPLGYSTANEMKLLSFLIAGFHKIVAFIDSSATVTYSAVLFPAFMFGFTAIAFFLFARKIMYKQSKAIQNLTALLATFIFVLIPSLLPRTIAGIPEKESVGFGFMFLALYFFMEAFTSEKLKRGIIFGILSGISTALMALVWGGAIMLFLSIPAVVLIAFILGKVKTKEFCIYLAWFFSAYIVMMPYFKSGMVYQIFASTKYEISDMIQSVSTSIAIAVMILIGVSLILMKMENKKIVVLEKRSNLPRELFYILFVAVILFVLITLMMGPAFIIRSIDEVHHSLVSPLVSRFGITVAENKQPYFTDWRDSFGPIVMNLPLFFWMFFLGAVVIFGYLISPLNKKYKKLLVGGYLIFLIALIFSRYSGSNLFNGNNEISLLLYFGGALLFLAILIYCYIKIFKDGESHTLKEIDFSYILYLVVFTLGLVIARGGIRFIMILGAIAPIAIAILVVKTTEKSLIEKEETKKFLVGALAILFILASMFMVYTYYKEDVNTAKVFAPGPYQWQWQKAMQWVREETPTDSVFIHWWDYGYWVQSIGERATALDGGNFLGYWNHLMGRYGLTGPSEKEALEFFYPHKVTHLLIDSTDIGKYTAFSSIGSDENYDRYSWISTFMKDDRQTQEMQNETLYVYSGGASTDEDIILNDSEGKNVLLPKGATGLAGIIVRENVDKTIKQPEAIFIYGNKQYSSALRYAYVDGKLQDFKTGLNAGVFVFSRLDQASNGGVNLVKNGVLMYLSPRTIDSRLARLYLFGEESKYFELEHSEDDYFIDTLKQQGLDTGEFLYYQGFRGPIKIWGVTYPKEITVNEDFLRRDYPDSALEEAKPGAY